MKQNPVRIVAALAVIGVLAAGIFVLVDRIRGPQYEDYVGSGTGEALVEVISGNTLTDIGRTLELQGVVKDYRKFAQESASNPDATSIAPGFYALRKQMSAREALLLMLDPASRLVNRVVIPEGTRLTRIIDVLAGALKVEPDVVAAAVKEVTVPDYAKSVEGYLFPATYDLAPNETAAQALQTFIKRFTQAARTVDLVNRAAQVGRTPHEIVTIASIIEAEVDPKDFGKASRVIYNRLEQGMKLQMDSTVNYSLGGSKLMFTPEQLKTQSTYNTYVIAGLPPAPIGSPGEAALEAALAPEPGDWLWFVSVDPDAGVTKFASTEREFFRYREEFQQWYRENR